MFHWMLCLKQVFWVQRKNYSSKKSVGLKCSTSLTVYCGNSFRLWELKWANWCVIFSRQGQCEHNMMPFSQQIVNDRLRVPSLRGEPATVLMESDAHWIMCGSNWMWLSQSQASMWKTDTHPACTYADMHSQQLEKTLPVIFLPMCPTLTRCLLIISVQIFINNSHTHIRMTMQKCQTTLQTRDILPFRMIVNTQICVKQDKKIKTDE